MTQKKSRLGTNTLLTSAPKAPLPLESARPAREATSEAAAPAPVPTEPSQAPPGAGTPPTGAETPTPAQLSEMPELPAKAGIAVIAENPDGEAPIGAASSADPRREPTADAQALRTAPPAAGGGPSVAGGEALTARSRSATLPNTDPVIPALAQNPEIPQIPQVPKPEQGVQKAVKETVYLAPSAQDRANNAAWWLRRTKQSIFEAAIEEYLARLEAEHGGPFPQREGDLRRGRPPGR